LPDAPLPFLDIVLIAFGLAMDAFAVSVASGVVIKEEKLAHAVRIALFFGGFQAIMPLLGWLAGAGLVRFISGFDHWVAFGLLTLVGCKMIYEAFKFSEEEKMARRRYGIGALFILGVATSIDALAVGFSLSVLHQAIITPVIVIGLVTFVLSLAGVGIGDRFGHWFESKIEIAGGLTLIGIGVKILLAHFS